MLDSVCTWLDACNWHVYQGYMNEKTYVVSFKGTEESKATTHVVSSSSCIESLSLKLQSSVTVVCKWDVFFFIDHKGIPTFLGCYRSLYVYLCILDLSHLRLGSHFIF